MARGVYGVADKLELPARIEFFEEWAKALRSGTYPQARSFLHSDDGYCCLGVAVEVARDKGLYTVPWTRAKHVTGEDQDHFVVGSDDQFLPHELADLLGIHDDGEFPDHHGWFDQDDEEVSSLTDANDDREWDFDHIADLLDNHVKDLKKGLWSCGY